MLVRGSGASVDGKVEVHVCARDAVQLGFGLASQRCMEKWSLGRGRWRAACLQNSAEAGAFRVLRERFRK